MIGFPLRTHVIARATRLAWPAAAAALLGACASTAPAPVATSQASAASVPLQAAAALQRAGNDAAYQPPADAPTAYLRFERPENLDFNLANVHLDNENCAGRQEFVGEPASNSFHGAIEADGEITVSTWSDATWVGPQPFDIEFCNAIFTFAPEPGQDYLVARPRLENECRVDVFRADGGLVDVQMRQPISAESDNDAWCQDRLPGSLGETNKTHKELVNLPGATPQGRFVEL